MNRRWTDDALERAISMQANGMSWAEVAKAFGERLKSLHAAVARHRQRKAGVRAVKDARPIAQCPEMAAYQIDAVQGSARLRDEIQRVFGGAA